MSEIKTRKIAEKGVKTLDKAVVVGERMKNAYIRTKEGAMGSVGNGQGSANEYAGNKVEYAAEDVSRKVIRDTGTGAQKAIERGREAFKERRSKVLCEKMRERSKPNEQGFPETGKELWPTRNVPRDQPLVAESQEQPMIRNRGVLRMRQQTAVSKARQDDSADRAGKIKKKPAQKTVKQTGRTVKTVEKATKATVKTAEQTTKVKIKTEEATTMATQRAIHATERAARVAAQAARAAAKAAALKAKAAAKAVASAIKASIAAVKALVTTIAAGGWVAVLAIVIICLIGLLAGSVFGIFFSGEDTGTGQTMQTAVREINTEYQDKLTAIRSNNAHDVLEMSGTRAEWREVLAVYAVKTTTDSDDAQDVASMDDSKKELLKDVFWAMNTISSRTANETRNLTTETADESGNIVETTTPTAVTVLYISVTHRTAEEMADYYGFNEEQRSQLAELLTDEYQSLWSAVLYGIGSGDGLIVEVALSQIGNVGGQPYWSWYGFGSRVEWCACFVSWCANESGYIDAGIIPKFAGCVSGSNWFKDRELWQDNSYMPRPGDIIFFDWDDPDGYSGPQDGVPDHVGIVERVDGGYVYTVEGNSGDACRQRRYPVGYYQIYGYGTPCY